MVQKVGEQVIEESWLTMGAQESGSDSESANASTTSERSASPSSDQDLYDKPPHSYVALISMAILASEEKKLMLGDIYSYIQNTFPYYKHVADKAWRNSIRHNLSLNECFMKSGRAEGNKGHYWSIHPNCVEEFAQGDYRKRQARRRTRRRPTSSAAMPNVSYVEMTSFPSQGGRMTYQHSATAPNPRHRFAGSHGQAAAPSCYYGRRQQPYPTASAGSHLSITVQSHVESSLPSHRSEALVAPPNVQLPQALLFQNTPALEQQVTSFNLHNLPSYSEGWGYQSSLPTYIDDFNSLQGTSDLPSLRDALLGLSALAN